jgi:hypothetical protein
LLKVKTRDIGFPPGENLRDNEVFERERITEASFQLSGSDAASPEASPLLQENPEEKAC